MNHVEFKFTFFFFLQVKFRLKPNLTLVFDIFIAKIVNVFTLWVFIYITKKTLTWKFK